ncbi:hypothetical protein AURDEDRAFT_124877 [Auricularia subglabra TFB-10046 SS5]|nr:hypothetical protein AURDEDRAFT_124877 [Auricularia subglabra TFB-10046 SS5]
MVNWNDPTTLYLSARATVLTQHTVFGIYLTRWEILNYLAYDWDLVVRRRRFNLASTLYILARYTALAAFVVQIRTANALTKINCEAWVFAAIGLPYVSIAFCTGLLSLRVFALSGKNKLVLAVLSILYAGFWASILYGISESVYIPELYACGDLNLKDHRINTFVQFGIDLVFILFMAVFLLRGHRGLSLWKFLVQQSAIYFIGVTFGYFLAAVFLLLPLNDIVAQSTGIVGLLIDVICATRMQRDLMEYNEPEPASAATGSLMFAAPTQRETAISSQVGRIPSGFDSPGDLERGESATTVDGGQEKITVQPDPKVGQ